MLAFVGSWNLESEPRAGPGRSPLRHVKWMQAGVPRVCPTRPIWNDLGFDSGDWCNIPLIEISVCQRSLTARRDGCLLFKGAELAGWRTVFRPTPRFLRAAGAFNHLRWWVWLWREWQPAKSPSHQSSARLINRTQGKVTLSNDYSSFLRYIIMMVIILEGIVAIIPRLTQRLWSGSFFSIISKPTATPLNPKVCVLVKTHLCWRKLGNDNGNVNFSETVPFLLYYSSHCRMRCTLLLTSVFSQAQL